MSTSSVKRWKKFHLALWLTSVLFLVSCSSQKQVTKVATQGVVNKNIQQQVDSLARLAIDEQAERLFSFLEDSRTTLILFDTDKPTNDSTGLPPVKAVVHNDTKREGTNKECLQKAIESDSEVKKTTTDKSVEERSSAVEVEQKPNWWSSFWQRFVYVLFFLILIIALVATYKLIKKLKS